MEESQAKDNSQTAVLYAEVPKDIKRRLQRYCLDNEVQLKVATSIAIRRYVEEKGY